MGRRDGELSARLRGGRQDIPRVPRRPGRSIWVRARRARRKPRIGLAGGMRWRKLGKIFDPTTVDLPHGCREFAQSPQALVFDDFVRVYFSTRAVDVDSGKYRSHVA